MKFFKQSRYRNQDSGPNDQVFVFEVKFTQLNKRPTTPKYKVNNQQRLT